MPRQPLLCQARDDCMGLCKRLSYNALLGFGTAGKRVRRAPVIVKHMK